MDSRDLAALLSSLVSELLLLLFLSPSSIPNPIPNSNSHGNIFPLIHHFLSTSEIATSLSLLSISRKRKRTHQTPLCSTTDDDDDDGDPSPELDQPGRVDSAIPRDPVSFRLCFRMSPSTFEWLAGLLEPLLECRDPIGSPLNLPAETRLGIGLFRLSTGADFPDISRRFRVSDSVAKFCVKQFCRVLCTNFRFWVGFPSASELGSVSSAFESFTGIPNCCGFISCVKFRIAGGNERDSSKTAEFQEQSIAAQIVVDSSSRILSIVAGFGGNNSDWVILKSSSLYKDIESGSLLNSPPIHLNTVPVPQYLIGDGNYPLTPWLIVPFSDPLTGKHEENFNKAHDSMRLSAVRTVVSLRNWGVLSKPIEAEFKTAVAYIGACSILHNVLLMREDYSGFRDGFVGDSVDDQRGEERCRGGDLEGNSVEEKGLLIRKALATRAKEVSRKSDQEMDIDCEDQIV